MGGEPLDPADPDVQAELESPIAALARRSRFGGGEVFEQGIGFELRLAKAVGAAPLTA